MPSLRKISLTSWILLGLIAGVLLGVFFPAFAVKLTPVSNIFLRLIKSIIGPLLFGTLVSGIASAGELKTMGRITAKALIYFEVVTTLALLIGLVVVNWLRPGAGMLLKQENGPVTALARPGSLGQIFEHAAPANIFEALAQNDVLQMVVFFFLFGAACAAAGAKAQPVVSFANAVAEVMFRYTNYVMYLAPFGVGAAIAVTVGSKGLGVLFGLGKLIGALYLALGFFASLILIPSLILVRIPLQRFWRWVREPALIAFSTASSEAALPVALENMERFGAPKHIAGFVLPLGYSFNLTGTTLYLSLATMFIAQGAGLHVPVGQQIAMMTALMLTSKGAAGVPRAALVILAATVTSFQLPQEGITLLLGVDALLDMGRTCINVLGNCVATAVIAKWEPVQQTEPRHRAGSVSDLDSVSAHLNSNMK